MQSLSARGRKFNFPVAKTHGQAPEPVRAKHTQLTHSQRVASARPTTTVFRKNPGSEVMDQYCGSGWRFGGAVKYNAMRQKASIATIIR
jgi:hypothetical protein